MEAIYENLPRVPQLNIRGAKTLAKKLRDHQELAALSKQLATVAYDAPIELGEELLRRRSADRASQVGSGDRSERIRTYNFPQGRMTDHRINLTLYKLDQVMQGDLDEVIDALTADDQARLLAEMAQ